MQCFMKREDKNLLSSPHWPPFCYNFVSSISVLLLSHSVQLTSSSWCSLFYPVGITRLNIATTSALRLKFEYFRGHCIILRFHHAMCSCCQYSGYDYFCYPG